MEKRAMVLKYFHLEMTHVTFHWLKEAIGHLTSKRPGNTILPRAQRKGKGKKKERVYVSHPYHIPWNASWSCVNFHIERPWMEQSYSPSLTWPERELYFGKPLKFGHYYRSWHTLIPYPISIILKNNSNYKFLLSTYCGQGNVLSPHVWNA